MYHNTLDKRCYNCPFISKFNDTPLKKVNTAPLLGVLVHKNFGWKSHILLLCKRIRRNIAVTYKLTHYLSIGNSVNVYFLVTSHLRYCSFKWNYGNITLTQKLINICKKLEKFINTKKK